MEKTARSEKPVTRSRQSSARNRNAPLREPRADTATAFSIAKQMAKALHELLGPMCEVVLHDFRDLEHSIIHIEGNVSNRTIGGAATDLILDCVRNGTTQGDLYGYATSLPGGHMMKSSTIFLRDSEGAAVGALCVNLDVTNFVAFRNALNVFVNIRSDDDERPVETLSDNILETVQNAVAETLYDTGRSLAMLTREDKIELMNLLESKGLFQVKRAVPIVADLLGLSRATVYNYLREGRDHGNGKRNTNGKG